MRFWFAVLLFVTGVACGGASSESAGPKDGHEVPPPTPGTSIDIAELEIRADGLDRFAHCPPSGDLGQGWIPKIPDWTPPAASGLEVPQDQQPQQPPEMQGQLPLTRTEKALEDTRNRFRDCYHMGLVHDPTQDGHVAVVLRLDQAGKVSKVESYGACELQHEVIRCLHDVAGKLRFAPPAKGDETVVLPVVFAPRAGRPHFEASSDSYAAQAFLAVEALRPALHGCEQQARTANRRIDAFATFTMEVDARGKITYVNVDPYGGEQTILSCAADVVQQLELPPPPGGRATLVTRFTFNPRAH